MQDMDNTFCITRMRSFSPQIWGKCHYLSTARLILLSTQLSANQGIIWRCLRSTFICFKLQDRAGMLCRIGVGRCRRFSAMNDTFKYIHPGDPGDPSRQPMTATNVAQCMRSVNLSAKRPLLYPSEPFCPASCHLTPEHVRLEHLLMGSCVSAITC